MPVTKEQIKMATEVIVEMTNVVKKLNSIPEGVLYASVMKYMSLDIFNEIISIMIKSGFVESKNNVLIWVENSSKSLN